MGGCLRALSTVHHRATRIMRSALASRPPPHSAHAAGEVEVLISHAYGLRRIATRCGCITWGRLGLQCLRQCVLTLAVGIAVASSEFSCLCKLKLRWRWCPCGFATRRVRKSTGPRRAAADRATFSCGFRVWVLMSVWWCM